MDLYDSSIYIEWNSTSNITDLIEPDEYVYKTAGDICLLDDNYVQTVIGKFRIFYVDVTSAINNFVSIFDVLDAHSGELLEYYELFLEKENLEFSNNLSDIIEYFDYNRNFLVIDRLEILPKYRGHKIGLIVLRHLIERFSMGTAFTAMKPFPLQFENPMNSKLDASWVKQMQMDQFRLVDYDTAIKRLCKYYGKLRFCKVPETPMMVISTDFPISGIKI